MTKSQKLSIAFFFLLTLMHLPHFFLPITGGHTWRQADTWAMAKNFAFEDPNFFLPRVDVRGDKQGIDAAETPFYPYLVSLFFRLFQTTHPFWGKFISFLCGMGLIYLLGKWISKELQIEPFLGYWVVGCIQIIFSYTHSFMPEIFSLFFSVLGSYLLFLDYQKKSNLNLILGFIFLTIGITSRPMQIFWGLSYVYLIYLKYKEKKSIAWRYFITGFLSLIIFSFWYIFWSEYLRTEYQFKYFARFVDEFSLKNLWLFLHWEIYFATIRHVIGENSVWVFVLAIVGFYLWLKNKSYQTRLSWLLLAIFILTWFAMILITKTHFIAHNYYLISLQPLLAYWATLTFSQFWQKKEKWAFSYALLGIFFIFANNFHTYRIPKDYFLLQEIKKELAVHPPKPLAIESINYAYGLYVLEKRGFVLYPEEIRQIDKVEELIKKGVAYFIVREKEKITLYTKEAYLAKLKSELKS